MDNPFLFPYNRVAVSHPFTAQEKELSSDMINYWTNFAKNLNPNRYFILGDFE